MKKIFILLAAAALFFTGCTKGNKFNADDLIGEWTIESVVSSTEIELCDATIAFEKLSKNTYSINGFSGVNQFFGQASVKNEALITDDKMASTKMAGSPEEMQFEDAFMECLTGSCIIVFYEIESAPGKKYMALVDQKNNISFAFSK